MKLYADTQAIFTGAEERMNRKGEPYHILNFLGNTGKTAGLMYKGDLSRIDLQPLKEYSLYVCITVDRYIGVEILELELVD